MGQRNGALPACHGDPGLPIARDLSGELGQALVDPRVLRRVDEAVDEVLELVGYDGVVGGAPHGEGGHVDIEHGPPVGVRVDLGRVPVGAAHVGLRSVKPGVQDRQAHARREIGGAQGLSHRGIDPALKCLGRRVQIALADGDSVVHVPEGVGRDAAQSRRGPGGLPRLKVDDPEALLVADGRRAREVAGKGGGDASAEGRNRRAMAARSRSGGTGKGLTLGGPGGALRCSAPPAAVGTGPGAAAGSEGAGCPRSPHPDRSASRAIAMGAVWAARPRSLAGQPIRRFTGIRPSAGLRAAKQV